MSSWSRIWEEWKASRFAGCPQLQQRCPLPKELMRGCRSRFCLAALGRAAVGAGSWAWRKPRSSGEFWARTLVLLCLCQSLCISCTSDSKDRLIWKPAGRLYICCKCGTSAAMMPWWCGVAAVLRAAGVLAVVKAGVRVLGCTRGAGDLSQAARDRDQPAWCVRAHGAVQLGSRGSSVLWELPQQQSLENYP